MKPKVFAAFVAPSMLLMFLFIAMPLVLVLWQSFYVTQPLYNIVEQEVCTPGFLEQTCTVTQVQKPIFGDDGKIKTVTNYVGFDNFAVLLKPQELWQNIKIGAIKDIVQFDFYRALRFTLFFTLITLPIVIIAGLAFAVTVNNAVRAIRGPVIFISLLPFIITPVIGALSIRWLFVGDGIITTLLENVFDRDISVFANGVLIEMIMMFYRVWHTAPFAFVIFYAGLQTVNYDTLESAIIDGASRLERLWYVVLPHLMPVIVFVSLIHLMDSYRVFDEVIGFRSEAYVISLQWLTFDFLTPDDSGNRSISRASASSMLTMVGIVILLIPLLRQTWREHHQSR